MTKYNLVAENPQSTVVAEYQAAYRTAKSYQSEAELERAFIAQLESQAYELLPITSEAYLLRNLRHQLEKLNGFTFTDAEWERFFTGEIANPNQSIAEKTITIQEDHIKNLKRDDGTVKNVYLLHKDKIHENSLHVINQFIASLDIHSAVDEDWQKYVEKKKIEELEEIIKQENLDHDETYKFAGNAFRNSRPDPLPSLAVRVMQLYHTCLSCLLLKPFPEIGVGDADHRFCSVCDALQPQVCDTVFSDHILYVRTRRRYDGARGQCR